MKKTYTLTELDLKILADRVSYPCVYPKCSRGQAQGDYGYCGCGMYADSCSFKAQYDRYRDLCEQHGLTKLADMLDKVDAKVAALKAAQKELSEELAHVGGKFGWKNLELLNKALYAGSL